MDAETKISLDYIKEGIDDLKVNCVNCVSKFDQSQKDQWESINHNSRGISKLKGWVAGILAAGVFSGILVGIIQVIDHVSR